MFKRFIERPVMATVISIILVILGLMGLTSLPLEQFPDIAPPSVLVTAVYPGANAETVQRSVAPSLEEAINGVEGMTYMTSTASNDGSLGITVFFKLGTNPDQAAVNVQNRVAQAMSQLPAEVVQAGVTTAKQQNSFIMAINLISEDEKVYDDIFLSNYANINIIPEIKRISGVGQAFVFGNRDYSMRVWLKPEQMAAYGLTPQEVSAAIQDQSIEAAPGKFGESSGEAFQYIIKYKGKLNQPEEYENIIIRANADGSVLRLKDVARVEFGSYTYGTSGQVNGKPGITIGILQSSGSNANQIQTEINELLEKASLNFPKGIKHYVLYSTKRSLDQSINQVKHTLIEAFILVFIVVFLFLQDFRSTLIPAIAVPVAIIGTFFFMQLFGFSINLLTLFALVLAIGIVVDDAIVVVEAVHAKMENSHMPAKEATVSAMSEITGAILSITLIMSAVFIPIGLIEGSTGLFYRQFAFTLAIAIVISAVNALTLSPALCALFLKNHAADEAEMPKKGIKRFAKRFFKGFNVAFGVITNKYVGGIKTLIKYKWLSLGGLAILIVATVFMVKQTPTGFIPAEDQDFAVFSLSMPPGSSLERTKEVMKEADIELQKLEATAAVNIISGFNLFTNSTSPSAGVGFIVFKPSRERGKVKNINAIMQQMNASLSKVKDGSFFVFTFPTVPGFGNVDALDVVLQDRSGSGKLDKFSEVSQTFIQELWKRKEIAAAFTSFRSDYPQLQLEVDEVKAKQLGVNIRDLLQTVQMFFGSSQASDMNRFGKYYRVILQADVNDRATSAAIDGIYVKNKNGDMVPVNTLVTLKRVYGPETVSRYNMFSSISVNAVPKKGYSTGDAINAVNEVAEKTLGGGYTSQFSGITKEEISSGNQSVLIFGLCLLFVYLLLAAQYESYVLPLAVIFSIPTGIFGVFVAIKMAGIDNNIYVQVALVMLIGLLAKNAILIVEYAVQIRKSGESIVSSAVEASRLRLRPIIMTSLAFIAGMIPMMRADGPSAMGNHSISIGAVGGMVTGVIMGLFIIPALYVVFQTLHEKIGKKPPSFKKSKIANT